ncbi:hypothetical protein UPYG_G00323820 [Umbra pygmaea]|uniref:non-specific serine/threonine protein kinase n=1 Tax=Umbra pygmaea TaxID=75934 RepID=A0ABD0WG46_UMBPY
MAPRRRNPLPNPLPNGFILTDNEKKKWKLGEIIGQGGFGIIYLASQDLENPVGEDSNFVIKVEFHENGPLFSELKFYQRAAKPEKIIKWKKTNKLVFLGIPVYHGSGQAEHNGTRYRFMAMDRLGRDLQKVCDMNGGRLKKHTVLQLGRGLLDVLEYIHENEYVHADIKAANLMLGHTDPDKVYLADYGLSYRYSPDGVHKEYKENPKKGHNGTIEYTSIDAHKGVAPSRRGDLEVLGFCLLHWLCGVLPWDSVLRNPTQVLDAKTTLLANLPGSVKQLSVDGASTEELAQFFVNVNVLGYKERPDYKKLRELLSEKGQRASGDQGRLDLSAPQVKKAGPARGSSRPSPIVVKGKETNEDHEEMVLNKERPKPVPYHYIRGPPKSQTKAHPVKVGGATGWSKPKPVYEDEESEEDDDMDRPRPVPSQYIRGPPISGPLSDQKTSTQSRRLVKKSIPVTSSPQLNQRQAHFREVTTPTKRKLGQTQNMLEESRQPHWKEHQDKRANGLENYSDHWENPNHSYEHGESEEYGFQGHGAEPSKQKAGWNVPLYLALVVCIFLLLTFLLFDGTD